MTAALDRAVALIESRVGRPMAALIFGFGLLILAALLVRPAIHTTTYGKIYAQMAADPLGSIDGNALGYRILTPAISWVLYLRGELIIVTNLILAVLFLAVNYLYFRARTPREGDGLFGAAVMASSLPTLFTLHDGGYTDMATYLLILLMWWFRKQRFVFYALFFLALLNRESVVFLAPWFALVRFQGSRKVAKWLPEVLVGYTATIGLYLLFRHYMSTLGEIDYTASYYLQPLLKDPLYWIKQAYPYQPLGLFTVFNMLWIFPVLAVIHMWLEGERQLVYSLAFLLLCVSAQLLVAYDSSRMFSMGFLVMIISLIHLFRTNAFEFRRWAVPVLILNFLVPQLYTAAQIMQIWHSTPVNILRVFVFGKPW